MKKIFESILKLEVFEKYKFFTLILLVGVIITSGCVNALYDKDGYCDIHKVQMKKRFVRVQYGLISSWPDEKNRNKKSPIEGGCVVGLRKIGVKYVCKICTKEAENK